jgi:tRNA(Ile)-lysidine synthase
VGFSGGLDSHVLLHALARLRTTQGWAMRAVHVHHGLHPQADEWMQHCERVCLALGVSLSVERIAIGNHADQGLEAAARQARYACLAGQLKPGETLLTAHHRDDQTETLLLQLLRGAGVHGLAAMPAVSVFARGRHARPLLGFRRVELRRYAAEHDLQWIEDSSNLDTRLARNFLRYRVLPMLEDRWPSAVEQLARSAEHAAEAAALLDEFGARDTRMADAGEGRLSIRVLRRFSGPRQSNLLRYWIRMRHGQAASSLAVRQLLGQVTASPKTRRAAFRLGRGEIHRHRDTFVFVPPVTETPPVPISWKTGARTVLPGTGQVLRAVSSIGSGLSQATLRGRRIEIRFRAGGERVRLRGHDHRQSLKKLLQGSGIPVWRRRWMPLVYVDDTLAAIGDRWICEDFAAGPGEASLVMLIEANGHTPRG